MGNRYTSGETAPRRIGTIGESSPEENWYTFGETALRRIGTFGESSPEENWYYRGKQPGGELVLSGKAARRRIGTLSGKAALTSPLNEFYLLKEKIAPLFKLFPLKVDPISVGFVAQEGK